MYPQSYSHHHLDGHVPDNEIRPGVSSAPHPSYDRVRVHGIPARNGHRHAGNSQSDFIRSYSPLKIIGDGLFGTVWLCDWHRALPPNTPMPAMQCGAGARPEYANKRLVAVKRIKKRWGGWDECERLKELQALRAIPAHSNVIPLYDCFFLPSTKELYLVFEPMEGNLWQLIKVRKGKPFAGGLVSSIFKQVASGLHHIHAAGYFHRDLKPENLLVTTTGKRDYRPVYDHAPPDASSEHDVIVIVKLADFGLARKIQSAPPYTEYVSTRWYRAPEVILKSREYSAAVDMWGFGVIMAEVLTLRPLLPGNGEIDQLAKICDLLGDPMDDHGVDPRGATVGGGKWPAGVAMANELNVSIRTSQRIYPSSLIPLCQPS
ncbi:protein kinase [Cristinia sonorae]|uniref:Protein kinase n=1 Tax=Cristinia sonorae TaxID=1940300 RepID=A0A8K0UIR0_9AGAR|nr:protein kinase [Cristinia sonorae]